MTTKLKLKLTKAELQEHAISLHRALSAIIDVANSHKSVCDPLQQIVDLCDMAQSFAPGGAARAIRDVAELAE